MKQLPAIAAIALMTLAGAPAMRAQTTASAAGSPLVKVLKPQDFWGEYAIWGATGFDKAGHIFFGMTSNDDRGSGSAHLFELNPATDTFTDRGNVVSELERLGLRRPGETQMKIHSRIVQAVDGYQYFASMDESGENPDGSRLPTWGGRLWRRGPTGAWEHLRATPEALIAVATGGPYVYALGYFNHVLYQFDTRTKRIRSVAVGSVEGHVSRNFFVDERGHAFVSRTAHTPPAAPTAVLVEFDAEMKGSGRSRSARLPAQPTASLRSAPMALAAGSSPPERVASIASHPIRRGRSPCPTSDGSTLRAPGTRRQCSATNGPERSMPWQCLGITGDRPSTGSSRLR